MVTEMSSDRGALRKADSKMRSTRFGKTMKTVAEGNVYCCRRVTDRLYSETSSQASDNKAIFS